MPNEMPSVYNRFPCFEEGDVAVVWTQADYRIVRMTYVEPLPASLPFRQDLGAVNAGATIQKTLITGIQLQENQLLQCRIKPLDDIDLLLWLQQGQAKFWIRNSQGRISLLTQLVDPAWVSSTFFVMSKDKDLFVEVRNLTDYNLNQARVQLWGWRAIWDSLEIGPQAWRVDKQSRTLVAPGQRGPVLESPWNGRPVLWVAGEGRSN